MFLFLLILVTLIGVLWGYYWLIRQTSVSANALTQQLADGVLELSDGIQIAVHNLTQRTVRLLAIIGLPITEIVRLEAVSINRLHAILVDILNNVERVVRNLAIAFSIWLGFIVVCTLLGYLVGDWLFVTSVVISMIILFFVTTTYDPIIAGIASKYKIRRSIRPISLVYGLSGIMFMWWLAFHGSMFYGIYLYILGVYILVLLAFGFSSYYFIKITNTAGYVLKITMAILLVISIVRIANERVYMNLSNLIRNNSEKVADDISEANANKTLNVFEVTTKTPVVTDITDKGITFGSTSTDSGQVILVFEPGDKVSVISEDIKFVGNEGFVKVMTQNEYGYYVDGPVFIPIRFLQKSEFQQKNFTKQKGQEDIVMSTAIQDTLRYNFEDGTFFQIITASGRPFLQANGEKWELRESGQMFKKIYPQDIVRGTVDGEKFFVKIQ